MTTAGTEDDNPPSHQNKFRSAGGGTVNGRTMAVGTAPFQRVPNNMEEEIHRIEQEAYSSVLRAFKAQSDAITWVSLQSNVAATIVYQQCVIV